MRTLLVANRGEIARRIIRTARMMGLRTVALVIRRRRRCAARPRAPPTQRSRHVLPRHRCRRRCRGLRRRGRRPPGIRVPLGERRRSPAPGRGGSCAGGAVRGRDRADGTQGRCAARSRWRPAFRWSRAAPTSVPRARAQELGLPVLVKAAAGGGGKGMRIVRTAAESTRRWGPRGGRRWRRSATTPCWWNATSSTAATSRSRCWATRTGRAAPLRARLLRQRRHQKVLEEAPAPRRSPSTSGLRSPRRPWPWPGTSATSAPGPWSSCSTTTGRGVLPGDEHPAAGRASGDRAGHRPGPGRAAADGRGGRAVAVHAGRGPRAWSRDRGEGVRGGPVPRVPAPGRHRDGGALAGPARVDPPWSPVSS